MQKMSFGKQNLWVKNYFLDFLFCQGEPMWPQANQDRADIYGPLTSSWTTELQNAVLMSGAGI